MKAQYLSLAGMRTVSLQMIAINALSPLLTSASVWAFFDLSDPWYLQRRRKEWTNRLRVASEEGEPPPEVDRASKTSTPHLAPRLDPEIRVVFFPEFLCTFYDIVTLFLAVQFVIF